MMPCHAPSSRELLDVWDAGRTQHPLDRALSMMRAFTDLERHRLAELSIGERDELLLALRRRFFGDRLEAVCVCEHCGEPNEFVIDAAALPIRTARDGPAVVSLEAGGTTMRARLPTTFDLAAVVDLEPDDALRALVERCTIGAGAVSDAEVERLDALMQEAEPLAALDVVFPCCVCERPNATPFDAGAFLWNDLDDASRRLILDVDALASAYGWPEAEILALSPRRRATYVQLGRR